MKVRGGADGRSWVRLHAPSEGWRDVRVVWLMRLGSFDGLDPIPTPTVFKGNNITIVDTRTVKLKQNLKTT